MTTTHTQPAGCGLDRDQAIELMLKRDMLSQRGYRLLLNGDGIEVNLGWLTTLANAARAAQAPQGDIRQGAHTCTPADERELPQRWQDRLPKGAGLSYDYAHVSAMKQEIEEWRARAAQGAGTAPVTLMDGVEQYNSSFDKACGKFYRDHGRLPAPIEIFAIASTPPAPVSTAAAPVSDDAMRECPDCEGNQRISAVEWCKRCNASGILPDDTTVSTAAATTASASLDDDEVARLRRAVRALGMESEVPADDATLRGALFAVLGQIARKLETRTTSRAADGQQGASRAALSGEEMFNIAAPYFAWNADSWHKATQATITMQGLLNYTRAVTDAALARAPLPAQADGQAVDDAQGYSVGDEMDATQRLEQHVNNLWTNGDADHGAAQSRAQSDTTGDHNADQA